MQNRCALATSRGRLDCTHHAKPYKLCAAPQPQAIDPLCCNGRVGQFRGQRKPNQRQHNPWHHGETFIRMVTDGGRQHRMHSSVGPQLHRATASCELAHIVRPPQHPSSLIQDRIAVPCDKPPSPMHGRKNSTPDSCAFSASSAAAEAVMLVRRSLYLSRHTIERDWATGRGRG
jgi:hypothetical protein